MSSIDRDGRSSHPREVVVSRPGRGWCVCVTGRRRPATSRDAARGRGVCENGTKGTSGSRALTQFRKLPVYYLKRPVAFGTG
eukprot:5756427-Prymnesium_polylepis.1